MYVTQISRYIQHSVLSAVSRNRGRSWNVLPVDTGAQLYLNSQLHTDMFWWQPKEHVRIQQTVQVRAQYYTNL
jgi:hypothetical protein